MKCNHDNPPPYPNWIWSCSKCGQQFTNKLNTQEDKPMKPLSQTRQAIVEEFRSKKGTWELYGPLGMGIAYPKLEKWLTQALNDYNEAVIRMVERSRKMYISETGANHEENNLMKVGYNQALNDIKEELGE